MANFPGSAPSIPTSVGSTTLALQAGIGHAALHNLVAGEVTAIAAKVGTGASTPTDGTFLVGNGVGTSAWRAATKSDVGLAAVDNTSDVDKPVSTAQAATLAPKASPVFTGQPTISDFTSSPHNHTNAANGGQLSNGSFDWSTFANNIKSSVGSSSLTPSNGSDNDFASICSISFTVSGTAYALVSVSTSVTSSSDFEHQPLILLDGAVVARYQPAAQAGNASGRSQPRTFSAAVTLTNGVHTLSPGAFVNSGTSLGAGGAGTSISAIILGKVTA